MLNFGYIALISEHAGQDSWCLLAHDDQRDHDDTGSAGLFRADFDKKCALSLPAFLGNPKGKAPYS